MAGLTVAAFLLTQGVGIGQMYDATDYLNGTLFDLNYLGVKNARAGWSLDVAGNYTVAQAASVAAIAKLDLLSVSSANPYNNPTTSEIANFASLQATAPGSIRYVEGANEINNFPILFDGYGGYITGSTLCSATSTYYNETSSTNAGGSSELNAGIAYQQAVYSAVTSNTTLVGVGVIGFTGYSAGSPNVSGCDGSGNPLYLAAIPNTTDMISAGYATANNQHPYPTGIPSALTLAQNFPLLTSSQIAQYQASGQLVYTETGYNSYYVTNSVQAQYTVDLLLDNAKNQIAVTYLFTLNDGDGSDLYGLFTAYDNGSCANCAKPVAVAIHNMNTILSAGNTGFIPNPIPLPYTVSGENSTSFDLEMTSTNGNSVIALWNEGTTTLSESVTLAVASNIKVYDPFVGITPTGTFSNVTTLSVSVGTDALLIEATPLNCVSGG